MFSLLGRDETYKEFPEGLVQCLVTGQFGPKPEIEELVTHLTGGFPGWGLPFSVLFCVEAAQTEAMRQIAEVVSDYEA